MNQKTILRPELLEEGGKINMKRTPLATGSILRYNGTYSYNIDRVIGDGASSIVYEAHYFDSVGEKHNVRLKECYPYASDIQRIGNTLVWADPTKYDADKTAFIKSHIVVSNLCICFFINSPHINSFSL